MNIDGHDATIVREVNAKSSNGAGQVPYTNKEPQGLLLKALKMAATYYIVFSPTMRSTIGVAELCVARSALPSAAPSRCAPLPCLPP